MSMGGDFGRGIFGGGMGGYGPTGPYGAWPGCGCSSVVIIIAGIILTMGGCLRLFGF